MLFACYCKTNFCRSNCQKTVFFTFLPKLPSKKRHFDYEDDVLEGYPNCEKVLGMEKYNSPPILAFLVSCLGVFRS